VGLSPRERRLFDFALKAREDPHNIGDAEVHALRALGTTDQQFVEVLEVMNLGNSINLFCDALEIEADHFLTYPADAPVARGRVEGGNAPAPAPVEMERGG
jgi:hypothetical protein